MTPAASPPPRRRLPFRWRQPLLAGLAMALAAGLTVGGAILASLAARGQEWLDSRLDGPLQAGSLSLGWRGLELEDVRMGNLLSLSRGRVGLNPLAGSFGEVELDGLTARLDWVDGHFDLAPWQTLVATPPRAGEMAETMPGDDRSSAWLALLLRRLVVRDASLTIASATAPLKVSLQADIRPGSLFRPENSPGPLAGPSLWAWSGQLSLTAIATGCEYPGLVNGLTGRLDVTLSPSARPAPENQSRENQAPENQALENQTPGNQTPENQTRGHSPRGWLADSQGEIRLEAGAGAVRVPDGILNNADISLSGPASWTDGIFRLAIGEGHGATHSPASLRGLLFPQGFAWRLRPTAAGESGLELHPVPGNGLKILPRLAIESPDVLVGLPSGSQVQARFRQATLGGELTLPPSPASLLEARLEEGTLTLSAQDASHPSGGTSPPAASRLELSDLTMEVRRQGFATPDELLQARLGAILSHLPGEGAGTGASEKAGRENASPLAPLRLEMEDESEGEQPHRFSARLQDRQGRPLLLARGSHDLAIGEGSAHVEVPPLHFLPEGLQPAHLHSGMAAGMSRVSGTLGAAGEVRWTPRALTSDLNLAVEDLSLTRGFLQLEHLNGAIHITRPWPLETPPGQTVSVAMVQAGLPLHDGLAHFHLDGKGFLVLEDASLTLAGGTLALAPVALPLPSLQGDLRLDVRALDLDSLARLFQVDGLTASGTLSGSIPLSLREADLLIRKARLATDAPGAVRYRPKTVPAALSARGIAVDLMLRTLDDFQYQNLEMTLDGSAIADLRLGVQIRGRNPAFYSGHPVEFNLSLQGALSQIVGGTLYPQQVPERIRERIQEILRQSRGQESATAASPLPAPAADSDKHEDSRPGPGDRAEPGDTPEQEKGKTPDRETRQPSSGATSP